MRSGSAISCSPSESSRASLASPDVAAIEPTVLTLEDLALVGLLVPDPLDGLPNFRVIREPPPWAGAS